MVLVSINVSGVSTNCDTLENMLIKYLYLIYILAPHNRQVSYLSDLIVRANDE